MIVRALLVASAVLAAAPATAEHYQFTLSPANFYLDSSYTVSEGGSIGGTLTFGPDLFYSTSGGFVTTAGTALNGFDYGAGRSVLNAMLGTRLVSTNNTQFFPAYYAGQNTVLQQGDLVLTLFVGLWSGTDTFYAREAVCTRSAGCTLSDMIPARFATGTYTATITGVPEPVTAAVLGLAVLGLAGLRRHRA